MYAAGTNMVAQYNLKVSCKISFYLEHQIFLETRLHHAYGCNHVACFSFTEESLTIQMKHGGN